MTGAREKPAKSRGIDLKQHMPAVRRFGRVIALWALGLGIVAALWWALRIGDLLAAHIPLLCGMMAITCAFTVMWQEILLGPSSPNYPPGPWWVRSFLFFWMVGMAMRGVDILSSLGTPRPQSLPWSAAFGWLTQEAAQIAILLLIAKQRRPQWFWSAAQRAEAQARSRRPVDVASSALEVAAARRIADLAPVEGSGPLTRRMKRLLHAID